jgi:hypothetical protein
MRVFVAGARGAIGTRLGGESSTLLAQGNRQVADGRLRHGRALVGDQDLAQRPRRLAPLSLRRMYASSCAGSTRRWTSPDGSTFSTSATGRQSSSGPSLSSLTSP